MKPRVLVLDDEPAVARALKRVLTASGFEVDAVNGASAARAKMRERVFAVVISDERMPEMSGVDFLSECAQEYPATIRLLLTGYADAQTAADAVNRAEIFRLLFKPWSEAEFIAAVREAAWRHSLMEDDEPTVEGPPRDIAEDVEPN